MKLGNQFLPGGTLDAVGQDLLDCVFDNRSGQWCVLQGKGESICRMK